MLECFYSVVNGLNTKPDCSIFERNEVSIYQGFDGLETCFLSGEASPIYREADGVIWLEC